MQVIKIKRRITLSLTLIKEFKESQRNLTKVVRVAQPKEVIKKISKAMQMRKKTSLQILTRDLL